PGSEFQPSPHCGWGLYMWGRKPLQRVGASVRAASHLIRAGRLGRRRLTLGNPDHRGPQQPVVQHIAGLQHLDDGAAGLIRPLGLEDRLVEIVIEALALGIDALDPVPLEDAQEFALSSRNPREKAARAVVPDL